VRQVTEDEKRRLAPIVGVRYAAARYALVNPTHGLITRAPTMISVAATFAMAVIHSGSG
jgi:hypothetical protein